MAAAIGVVNRPLELEMPLEARMQQSVYVGCVPGAPESTRYQMMEKLMAELHASDPTDFKVTKAFHGNIPGTCSQDKFIGALRMGKFDIGTFSPQDAAQEDPRFNELTVPYRFNSYSDAVAFYLSEDINNFVPQALNKLGVELLGVLFIGTRCIGTKHGGPILQPGDLQNEVLRAPPGTMWKEAMHSLGAPNVASISIKKLLEEQDQWTAVDNPVTAYDAYKIGEIIQNVSATNHSADLLFLGMSRQRWNHLRPEQQVRVKSAALKAIAYNNQEQTALEQAALQKLKAEGKLHPVNRELFKQHVSAYFTKHGAASAALQE